MHYTLCHREPIFDSVAGRGDPPGAHTFKKGKMTMTTKLFFTLFLLMFLVTPTIYALETQQVAGNYELQGVMEMAGGLMLKKNNTYMAGFSYGAADWEEEGTWKLEGDLVVLEGGHLKVKNKMIPSPLLAPGMRFLYKDAKLMNTDPSRKLTFINPNKTPSPKTKTKDSAGEGRMRVQGKVIQLDSDVLVIKTKECMQFDVRTLSEEVLKTAKAKMGKMIDVEIPYSSIIGGGSCP